MNKRHRRGSCGEEGGGDREREIEVGDMESGALYYGRAGNEERRRGVQTGRERGKEGGRS